MSWPIPLLQEMLRLRVDMGAAWDSIARDLNANQQWTQFQPFTAEGVRSRYRRAKERLYKPDGAVEQPSGGVVIHLDKKEALHLTLDDMLGEAARRQDLKRATSQSQSACQVFLPTREWALVSFWSDIHFGSGSLEARLFLDSIETLRANPQIKLALGGDLLEMFLVTFKDARAPVDQMFPPNFQLKFAREFLDEFQDRIVAMIRGNHDEMPDKRIGIDLHGQLVEGRPFPYMPHGGLMDLLVGEERDGAINYRVAWKHHYGNTSQLNPFNRFRRLEEWALLTADIHVLEHLHSPSIAVKYIGGHESVIKKILEINNGAFKQQDGYSLEYFRKGIETCATVALCAKEKKFQGFVGPDAMQDALRYSRS